MRRKKAILFWGRKSSSEVETTVQEKETAVTEEDKFKIKVFNVIIDKLNQSMTNRFADHKNLYLYPSCFDPKRFSELKKGLPSNTFDKICDLIPNIDKGKLIEELESVCSGLAPDILLVALDNDMVIDKLYEQSEEMRRLLVL
ncbi:hypothetical protein PR048_004869 [Dryococelus australis]|uniref:Uncharacterized protein n=1 Tax=Dryococelus australis TaxID=614101 RepID=A0ABQ9I6M6_9NEOP|nr:hypothetical protein PR048_004869 [Dryococelus australis]